MAATVVYDGVPSTQGGTATLFQGQRFWFSASVPQRKWLMENVKAHGGEVVFLENQADVLLVDDAKKNAAPGTHSYKYVDLSIRRRKLENLADHVVGGTLRADRPVGSVTMAPKGGRNPYTAADDQALWDWVKPLEEAGAATSGNLIYQQLEAVNPRHTFQSWRDRWLKHVRYQTRQITTQPHEEECVQAPPKRQPVQAPTDRGVEGSPARNRGPAEAQAPAQIQHRPKPKPVEAASPQQDETPDVNNRLPVLQSRGKARSRRNAEYEKCGKPIFTEDDYKDLFEAALSIMLTPADLIDKSWEDLVRDEERKAKEEQERLEKEGLTAKQAPVRVVAQWRAYFDLVVGPDYEEQLWEETGTTKGDYLKKGEPAQVIIKTENAIALSENNRLAETLALQYGHRPGPSPPLDTPILVASRPESPVASFSTTQDRAVGPNEARKRSAAKGTNSQESNNSAAPDADSVKEPSQRGTQSQKRKRNVGSDDDDEDDDSLLLPPFGNQEQAKRRKVSLFQPRSLEIPSTPESDTVRRLDGSVDEQDQRQEVGSPTSRPRRSFYYHERQDDIPSSPLFVPQDPTWSSRKWSIEPDEDKSSRPVDDEENEMLPFTPRRTADVNEHTRTSPLSVHLVSDHDPPPKSSFSPAWSEEERGNGSPTPDFETATESSQVWEATPEEAEAARPDTHQFRDGTIAETQLKDDFAVPEPEGGWDAVVPPDADEEEGDADDAEPQGDADAISDAESLRGWVAAHMEADPDVDDELLLKAVGIADLDFKLADIVYRHLAQGRPVPEDMKGVWTERDDNALRGDDAEEIKRIEEKHGSESMAGRWQWLENADK